jgi:hypothetical protein
MRQSRVDVVDLIAPQPEGSEAGELGNEDQLTLARESPREACQLGLPPSGARQAMYEQERPRRPRRAIQIGLKRVPRAHRELELLVGWRLARRSEPRLG